MWLWYTRFVYSIHWEEFSLLLSFLFVSNPSSLLQNAGRFKCSSCPRTFQVKGQWEKHERTHMDEKPFRCELCQMSFKSEDSVRLHHRNKHGVRISLCHTCSYVVHLHIRWFERILTLIYPSLGEEICVWAVWKTLWHKVWSKRASSNPRKPRCPTKEPGEPD